MQALVFERTGDLAALALRDVPAPELRPGEAVVKIAASGLNPSDVKNVEGLFAYTTVPRTPGRDFAGVVVQGPANLVGARVWGTGKELGFTRDGSHAEFIALPARGVSLMPDAMTFEQAANVGVPYTTAWSALERSGVESATRVIVVGANGAVGSAAIALSRWRGASVAGVVRRSEDARRLENEGVAARVVDTPADLVDRVHEVFAGGADVIVDTTGAYLAHAVPALAPQGRIAVIAAPHGGNVEVPVLALYRRGGVIVGVNSLLYDSEECAKMLDRIRVGFQDRHLLLPSNFTTQPFSEAIAAYHAVKSGSAGKRVFVTG